jgi:hypothetical protein
LRPARLRLHCTRRVQTMSKPERVITKIIALVLLTVGTHSAFVELHAVPWSKPGSNQVAACVAEALFLAATLTLVCAFERIARVPHMLFRRAPAPAAAERWGYLWACLFVVLLASGVAAVNLV